MGAWLDTSWLETLFPRAIDGSSTKRYMQEARPNEIVRPAAINIAVAAIAFVSLVNTRLKVLARRIATGKWIR